MTWTPDPHLVGKSMALGLQNGKRLVDLVQNRNDRNTLQSVAQLAQAGKYQNAGSMLMGLGLVQPGINMQNVPHQRQESKLAQLHQDRTFNALQDHRAEQNRLSQERNDISRLSALKPPATPHVTYGKSPSYHMVDGEIRFGVFGSDGSFKSHDNIKPATSLLKVDTATGTKLIGSKTGQEVAPEINKNIAAAESQKKAGSIFGESQAKAQINLQQVEDSTKYALDAINDVLNTPDMDSYVGVVDGRYPDWMSQGRQDFANRLKLLKGKQFVLAFESLKGSGQITEYESQSAAQALAVLETTSSDAQFRKALMTMQEIVTNLARRARKLAQPRLGSESPAQSGFKIRRVK